MTTNVQHQSAGVRRAFSDIANLPTHDAALTQGQLPALALPLVARDKRDVRASRSAVLPHSTHSAPPAALFYVWAYASSSSAQSWTCLSSLPPQREERPSRAAARCHGDLCTRAVLPSLAGVVLTLRRGRCSIHSLVWPVFFQHTCTMSASLLYLSSGSGATYNHACLPPRRNAEPHTASYRPQPRQREGR
jgi:hypothetical protein